jgi:hypothetical protein
MWWLGIETTRQVGDFIDNDGQTAAVRRGGRCAMRIAPPIDDDGGGLGISDHHNPSVWKGAGRIAGREKAQICAMLEGFVGFALIGSSHVRTPTCGRMHEQRSCINPSNPSNPSERN